MKIAKHRHEEAEDIRLAQAEAVKRIKHILDALMSSARNPGLVWAIFSYVVIGGESMLRVCSRHGADEKTGRRIRQRISDELESYKVRILPDDTSSPLNYLHYPSHD